MSLKLPPGLIAGVSGFRGRVGESVTPELFCALAAEFGGYLLDLRLGDSEADGVVGTERQHAESPPHAVLLARDSRVSGSMLAGAVRAGLESVGLRIVDLGIAPTPTLLRAVAKGDAIGGIAVTASHNPADWNALKLVDSDGLFLNAASSERFRDHLASRPPAPRAPFNALGRSEPNASALDDHLDAIHALPYIQAGRLEARRLRVAADCVNGAAGPALRRLLGRLGCELVGIGMEPDGAFHRDAEPLPANLQALSSLVLSENADLGLAFDPDGDRLALVDENGTCPGEDVTLALAMANVLSQRRGSAVVNLSTSRVVEDVAEHFGVPIFRAPVGEINVVERMREEGAVVGGEGNGGVILPELHPTRDALVGSALVLQHLADSGGTLSEAIERWPRYAIKKRKAPLPDGPLDVLYRRLERTLAPEETDRSDGLRLAWPSRRSWLHVRPSGTEPVLRFIAEAPEVRDARELVGRAESLNRATRCVE